MAPVRHLFAPALSGVRHAVLMYCALVSLPTVCPCCAQVPGAIVIRTAGGEVPQVDRARNADAVLDRYGTVILRDTPLDQALYALGQQWQVNIMTDGDVTGTATGIFRRATLREILDAILTENGYTLRRQDGMLMVVRSGSPTPISIAPPAVPLARNPSPVAKPVVLQIDPPRARVRLSAYIYQMSFEDLQRLTSQWDSQVSWKVLSSQPTGDESTTELADDYLFSGMLPEQLEVDTVVKAIALSGTAQLVSQHTSLIDNQQNYMINSRARVPVDPSLTPPATTATDRFDEVAIKLQISPRVVASNQLVMDIGATFQGPSLVVAANSEAGTLRAKTKLNLAARQAFIVGMNQSGHADESQAVVRSRIWKSFFRATKSSNQRNSLICVMAGEIVDSAEQPLTAQSQGQVLPTSAQEASTLGSDSPAQLEPATRRPHYRPTVYPKVHPTATQAEYRPSVYR